MIVPLILAFTQPMVALGATGEIISEAAMVGRYRISGASELRPAEISDDGMRTYIRWADEQELPAVFALNARGDEEMIDGYMRDGIYTIDRINPRLVFRIDKRAARADRIGPRK